MPIKFGSDYKKDVFRQILCVKVASKNIICIWKNDSVRTDSSTKRYHQTQAPNATIKLKHQTLPSSASTKRYHQAQAPNATTKRKHQTLPLVLAFSGSGTLNILQKLYIPSILHLTLMRRNSLNINTLLSVRYYKCYLHSTYTPHTLPHGTSTGGR